MTARDAEIYRALLEDLSDGVLVIDFDGSIRIANAAVCAMFGLDPADAVERRFGELFVAFEDFDEFTEIILDAVAERRDAERRVTRVRLGEEYRSLCVTTSYLTVPGVGAERVAMIAVIADITEVKELRENELRMAKVIETQLGELQEAYRDIEERNEALSVMMKRVQASRGVAVVFVVGLFLAVGAWYVQPLDLFNATAALDPRSGVEDSSAQGLQKLIVEPGELRSTLSLRGRLALGRIVQVVSPMESHVRAVHARPGQRVAHNDRLVDLDTGALAVEYRSARVEHIEARERLVALEDWENGAEMARARRAVRRGRIALEEAQSSLERAAFLLGEGLIPSSQHEEARRRHDNRRLDFEAAERELKGVMAQGGERAKEVARLNAENALAGLREHERKLGLAEIRAPVAGVVVEARGLGIEPLAKGRAVAQGELLLSIGDFQRLSVTTSADEVDVRKIEVGQRAWIAGPGFPGLKVEGAVTHVSPRADERARRGTPQFEIVVTLDRLDAPTRDRLRVGMSAHVTIVVRHRPEALLIPLGAVELVDGKSFVGVVDQNSAAVERRAVELGLTTLDSVEVVEGLSAGEQIVLLR